jgi:hypothetical protein
MADFTQQQSHRTITTFLHKVITTTMKQASQIMYEQHKNSGMFDHSCLVDLSQHGTP